MPAALPIANKYLGPERRAERRTNFPNLQRVTPLVPTHAGDDVTWQFVRGHDLAPHGFSFWSPERPAMDQLVWALDEVGEPTSLLIEVRHCTPVQCLRTPLYLVGCRMVGVGQAA